MELSIQPMKNNLKSLQINFGIEQRSSKISAYLEICLKYNIREKQCFYFFAENILGQSNGDSVTLLLTYRRLYTSIICAKKSRNVCLYYQRTRSELQEIENVL